MIEEHVSKSKFKASALQYFRQVEETGKSLVITDQGRPALRLAPYKLDVEDTLAILRNSVISYERPFDPVGADDWDALK